MLGGVCTARGGVCGTANFGGDEFSYSVKDLVEFVLHCGDCLFELGYSVVLHDREKRVDRK